MTKKEKNRVKTIILRSCVIGFVVIILAVCIIGWHGSLQIKSWHIFTNSRIEKLEEIYGIDFPDDTKFSHYSVVWNFIDGASMCHTLYIKDVADPEKFCSENPSFNIIYAEKERQRYANIDFGDDKNPEIIFCDVYFFQNSNGGYDAKLIWKYLE